MGDDVLQGKAAKYDFILFSIDSPFIPLQNYVQTYPLTPPQVATTKYIT
jgi:hypothetical protein